MNLSARPAGHATAPSSPAVPAREQSPLTPGVGTARALDEIARLANDLCEHLADRPWRTAARIRELAETALPMTGEN